MNDAQAKALCLALMKADSEEEVIGLLKKADLWDSKDLWRFYGDYENNYNTIGNQQGRPDAALVEKVVNAVDARLMNECLARGTDPEGPQAPQSIRQAVAMFFDDVYNPDSPHAGQVKNWPDKKRTETARWLTLVATGVGPRSGNPCFTISDRGEGQTPERMPDTFLSLTKSNKLRIPFLGFRSFFAAQAARFTQFFKVSISLRSSVGSADVGLIVSSNVARRSTCTI